MKIRIVGQTWTAQGMHFVQFADFAYLHWPSDYEGIADVDIHATSTLCCTAWTSTLSVQQQLHLNVYRG